MKPLDRLSEYLAAIERRLRLLAVTRGAAVVAAVAFGLTVVAVLIANHFAFSNPSVTGARLLLFLGLAFALAAGLIVPVIRLNRRRAARRAERKYPQFEERLLTFTERMESNAADPFLPLLADDALSVAREAEPREVAKTAWMFSFSSAAVVAALALLWLGSSGGFMGYGTSLLWGGLPKGEMKPYYSIQVTPGNRTVRKRSDQMIGATLMGFTAEKVRFFGRYASTSGWEQAEMRTEPGGSAYEFLIAGIPESLEYYVEAGGLRSPTYKLNVVDLPAVKHIRVTYHYPAWTGMKDAVEDPGGDLRAVEGTTADVAIQTDKPLASGAILLDDGTRLPLHETAGVLTARVPIQKDGMYHVAALESGENVRLSEDYFIEAQKYRAPEVSITRPGRDFRANPIEEVTVSVQAKDDFALKGVDLHYAVNGGAEKTIPLLKEPGTKTVSGNTVLSLEDFKVQPGDIVSIYASAKDARSTTDTDIFFIQAEPFERNYTQSQQAGGGGGGGGDEQNQISDREKEIITATWNQLKGQGAKGTDAENAAFLASVQSKLRDQTRSLEQRMRARQLEGAGDSFKSFVNDLDQAVNAMGPAADQLKGAKWKDALQPEQKALQYLLRAEATFRDIQVAFGQGGGGGGGMGGASRDLEGLFDLELDTEKNQYEGASQMQSADQRQRQIDNALEKLKQLAKRQQELAEQQRRNPQTPQQRWEQEMLRRQAEQLQKQLQQLVQSGQLSRNGSPQQGQQSQGGQPGQAGQQGQPGQMSQQQRGQMSQLGQDRLRQANAQQLRETLDRLQQALQDMRNAAGSQAAGTPQAQADARRAADRLNEAQQLMSGLRQAQASNQVDDLIRQADELARRQQDFEGQMRRAFGPNGDATRQKAEQLAQQKDGEAADLKKLEQGMQSATRDLQSTQRPAATKMRQALGTVEEQEIEHGMERNAEWLRRGLGSYAVLSEAQVTAGLNQLRDQLRDVQKAMGAGGKDGKDAQADKAMEQALGQVERLRRQMEQMAQASQGQPGQQGQRGQQSGQQGQQGGQQGQQGGQQGQQAGNQGGGNQSGQPSRGSPGNQGGGGNWNGTRFGGGDAAWNGTWNNGPNRRDFEQTYRDAMQSLGQLQQQLQNDPAATRDIGGMMRDLRQFDPFAYSNDPLLAERIQAALAGVEQVEMELRRKVDESSGGGSVRSPGSEPVPQGYQDAVADYFRRLSKSK